MKPDAKAKVYELAEEFIMRNEKASILVAVEAINTMAETESWTTVMFELNQLIAAAEEFKRRLLELER